MGNVIKFVDVRAVSCPLVLGRNVELIDRVLVQLESVAFEGNRPHNWPYKQLALASLRGSFGHLSKLYEIAVEIVNGKVSVVLLLDQGVGFLVVLRLIDVLNLVGTHTLLVEPSVAASRVLEFGSGFVEAHRALGIEISAPESLSGLEPRLILTCVDRGALSHGGSHLPLAKRKAVEVLFAGSRYS